MKTSELTRKLIEFDTTNPPGNEEKCIRHIGSLLKNAGFHTDYYYFAPKRPSLIARLLPPATATLSQQLPICFSGHVDVVPATASDWKHPPFKPVISDGKLYGRGASDMKGGVAAIINAALSLNQHRLKRSLILVITAGEENSCQGATHLAALPEKPLPEVGALLIAEPTSNYPYLGHKGLLWLKFAVRGKTAHSSMPAEGENAILKAARLLLQLEKYDFNSSPHPLLGAATLNPGTIKGGININSVPDYAEFTIDIRTTPNLSHQQLLNDLKNHLNKDVEIEIIQNETGFSSDPSHPWIQQVFSLCQKYQRSTKQIKAEGISYYTDGAVMKRACGEPPTIILGPGEPHMAHKVDEFCRLDRLEQATEIFLKIMNNWCLQF
ncbi:MAG: M20 family metallopeptidase [Deltaproteobacteria bacterium]|jgi:succinyl-diaminopimelate desuccinylase|nr:M20 family metallopeptidase [Deltaproteobacteria bacterium]